MAVDEKARQEEGTGLPRARNSADTRPQGQAQRRFDWKSMLKAEKTMMPRQSVSEASEKDSTAAKKSRWHMGMLGTDTEEVPGSVLLLSKVSEFNEPLGMQNAPARTSASSFPQSPRRSRESSSRRRWQSKQQPEKKKTPDGKFVLEPQPDDSLNDPLNWATWRRDAALLSLGFYCMLGGGMTPILAAGFHDVADEYHTSEPRVALTTGLYMMGLGLGSVVLSPTAILYGKRPVYLAAAVCFVLSSVWCALSPNFASLVCARIFQGFAVSSVECLPSATVAEIYFLHEKAYRLGIYTLLLLGGKNLVPLVSAAIIQSLGWRWVFWVVAMIVGFAWCLLLVCVPETVWDRTPVPHKQKHRLGSTWSMSHVFRSQPPSPTHERKPRFEEPLQDTGTTELKIEKRHAHFAGDASSDEKYQDVVSHARGETVDHEIAQVPRVSVTREDYFNNHPAETTELEAQTLSRVSTDLVEDPRNDYTKHNSTQPPKTWIQQMRPYSGRLSQSSWLRVMIRPFILFAYPSILWSALVYSLSIGWLIVLSESVSHIYISRDTYNFTSLQAGLVYISPFVGGILGTAVAGKVSDLIVRWLARRNGGIYEPEFRLVMAIPIAITTVIGLMGYGWSVQERDAWIVPTIFFGFISFGCSLGSTTSITFAVDSYRQYAGEALVTLNFSKNIFHGLVFSLFFNKWLESEGSRDVFVAIGGIQLACMLTTIPMYIYGKRARLWTVRKNFMEKF